MKAGACELCTLPPCHLPGHLDTCRLLPTHSQSSTRSPAILAMLLRYPACARITCTLAQVILHRCLKRRPATNRCSSRERGQPDDFYMADSQHCFSVLHKSSFSCAKQLILLFREQEINITHKVKILSYSQAHKSFVKKWKSCINFKIASICF